MEMAVEISVETAEETAAGIVAEIVAETVAEIVAEIAIKIAIKIAEAIEALVSTGTALEDHIPGVITTTAAQTGIRIDGEDMRKTERGVPAGNRDRRSTTRNQDSIINLQTEIEEEIYEGTRAVRIHLNLQTTLNNLNRLLLP